MDELKQYRGCGLFLLGLVILTLFGLAAQFLIAPLLGEQYIGPLVFAGLVLAFLIPIGLSKGARWAKIVTGILLLVMGLALTGLSLYDFGTKLITGQSLLSGGTGGSSYGQAMFILVAVGVGLVGFGAYFLNWIKMDLTR